MRSSPPLPVGDDDLDVLRGWATSDDVLARRARIVLLSANGLGPTAVATEVGCSKQTVLTWRERFRTGGLNGLSDAPRTGRPVSVDPVRVIERTLAGPPARLRARRWSSRLLAAELDVSNVAVAAIWRRWGVVPQAHGHVRFATEPALDSPLAGIVAVHIDPVVSVAALLAGDDTPAEVPSAERPRLGGRLAALDLDGPAPEPAWEALLDGLPADRVRLLAAAPPPDLASWAAQSGAVLHEVPDGLDWGALLRVACVLAGRTVTGSASVTGLRAALDAHLGGGPLRWRWTGAGN